MSAITIIIPLLVTIIGAFLTYLFTKRSQVEAAWRSEKLLYYKEFVDALAINVGTSPTAESQFEFSRASNNLLLVASPSVLRAHHQYRNHTRVSNANRDYSQDQLLLAELLNAIRNDLKLPGRAAISSSDAQLWASVASPRD